MEKVSDAVCRACLSTKQRFKYFIHKNVSHQMYTFCTSVEVSIEDQLTKALCNQCYNSLQKFSSFKQISIDSNAKLISVSKEGKDDLDELKEIVLINSEVKTEPEQRIPSDNEEGFDATNCDYLFSAANVKPDVDLIKKVSVKTEKRPKKKSNPVLSSSKKPKFKCEMCCTQYQDPDRFEAHLQWHEGIIVPIHCKPCNKTFNTWSGLRRHKEASHDTVPLATLACRVCGKVSKSKHALQSHLHYHTAKMAVCHVCGKEMRQSDIKVHLRTHSPRARPHACALCAARYLHKGSLDKHVRRRHEGRRYICDTCGASFCDKHALIAHFLRHEGKKTHLCDLCDKAFYERTSLVHHRRLHTGEKPFSCTFCSKQFIAKKRLVEHIRTHSFEKPHKCHLCPQMFAQRGTLKRHLKVHAKNGPVVGLECSGTVLVTQ